MKETKKILVHTCCAPCAAPSGDRLLLQGYEVTLFFSTSNIYPIEEYKIRLENVRKLEVLARETTPVGRMGTPQDVANIVVFLASDVSSYIVGQTISVNGGRLMI